MKDKIRLWWNKEVKWWQGLFGGMTLLAVIMYVYYFIKFIIAN